MVQFLVGLMSWTVKAHAEICNHMLSMLRGHGFPAFSYGLYSPRVRPTPCKVRSGCQLRCVPDSLELGTWI